MIPPTAAALVIRLPHQNTTPGCSNLARVIVRSVEDGGAPSGQTGLCNKDAKAEIEAAKAKGIAGYDMRNNCRRHSDECLVQPRRLLSGPQIHFSPKAGVLGLAGKERLRVSAKPR
jgi:hypothetical protein